MAVHCPECGFTNADGANYCQKCGAYLGDLTAAPAADDTSTATYRVGETGEFIPVDVSAVVESTGAAIVIRAGGGRVGESFPLDAERMTIGRRPDSDVFLDDVTVSRDHALIVRRGNDWFLDDLRVAERDLRQPPPHRVRAPRRRRRAAGRQVQAHVPLALMAVQEPDIRTEDVPREKAMTIGAVCKALEQEFPDISISKIRYLEDQKLVAPRRTPGGYRLYSASDAQRLRTILRLQRDEFLPLRVIRQELASGRAAEEAPVAATDHGDAQARRRRRSSVSVRTQGALYSLDDVLDETRAEPGLVGRARGVRRHQGRAARRGQVLRRDRARDHPRGHRARALRRRRAQPARVPDLGRPRVRAAAADPRPGPALAQHPSAARRRWRRWRTSPPSRRTSSTCCSSATCARSRA